jgi:hypothetical protein
VMLDVPALHCADFQHPPLLESSSDTATSLKSTSTQVFATGTARSTGYRAKRLFHTVAIFNRDAELDRSNRVVMNSNARELRNAGGQNAVERSRSSRVAPGTRSLLTIRATHI